MNLKQKFLLWLFTLAASTHRRVNLTLSLNETAIINPSFYFDNHLSDFTVSHSDSCSAAVLPQLEVKAVVEAETEGTDWRFGPFATTSKFTFFSIVYTHKLEVWRIHGDSVTKEWETAATVGRVVNVHLLEVLGFVYWTLPGFQLFVVDLESLKLSAQEISGVNLSSVKHLAICSRISEVITVQESMNGMVFSIYHVDYSAHKLVQEYELRVNVDNVIDIFCNVNIVFLSSEALYSKEIDLEAPVPLPAALGRPTALECLSSCEDYFVKAEKGVLHLDSLRISLMLPALKVVQVGSRQAVLEQIHSQLVIIITDLYSSRRKVPVDQEIEGEGGLLWLESLDDSGLFLLKQGKRVRLLELLISSTVVALTGELNPYEVQLCNSHPCVTLAVNALPEECNNVLIRREDYYYASLTIDLRYSINTRQNDIVVSQADLFSGANLQVEVQRFHTPPFMKSETCTEKREKMQFQHTPIPLNIPNSELLCADFTNGRLGFMFWHESMRIEVNEAGASRPFVEATRPFCVLSNGHFVKLIMEGQRCFFTDGSTKKFLCQSEDFIAMKYDEFFVFILFKTRVEIIDTLTYQWKTIMGKTEFKEIWVESKWMVLRTLHSFEFYRQTGQKYLLQGTATASPQVAHFTICGSSLLTLSNSGVLDVYYKSPSMQLIHRFSYHPPCPVLYIASDDLHAIYRCAQFVQFLSCNGRKHSFELQRVPTDCDSVPKWQIMKSNSVFEIHEMNWEWSVWKLTWVDVENLCIRLTIADGWNIAETVSFQGELLVSASDSDEVKIAANFTLENSSFIAPKRLIPIEVEVPWEEELRLDLHQLFRGKVTSFSAESSNPLIRVAIHSPAAVAKALPVPNWPLVLLQVAEEVNTFFHTKGNQILAVQFVCVELDCSISSTHVTPIKQFGFVFVYSLAVLFSIKSVTYLRVQGYEQSSEAGMPFVDSVITFDSSTLKYECKYSRHEYSSRQHYVILGSESRFRVIFYDYDMVYCEGDLDQMHCKEEQLPSLSRVVSLTGEVAGDCCHLRVLTDTQQLVEMQLCESLVVLNSTNLADISVKSTSLLLGNAVLILGFNVVKVYSLLDRSLVCEIPEAFIRKVETSSIVRAHPRFALLQNIEGSLLLDIEAPESLITMPLFSFFYFAGESRGVGVINKTLMIMNFSTGEVVLPSGKTSEGVITLTARNEMSAATLTFKVTRISTNGYLWIVAAGVVGSALMLLHWRKRTNIQSELELQRLS